MLSQESIKAYKQRWQLVAKVEMEEQQRISVDQRWQKLNALLRMAATLDLQSSSDNSREEVVWERWNTITDHYLAQPKGKAS